MPRKMQCVLLILLAACTVGCSGESDDNVIGIGASDTPSTADLAGYLQAVHPNRIIGWAWDKSRPDEPIEVTILDGSTELASVKADGFRKDLLEGKRGNGKHGFEVPMPESLKDGKPHEIHAFVSGTSFELKNSPKPYQFQRGKPTK